MPEKEVPLAIIIEASTTVVELLYNIERAGGIKKSNGKFQNLDELRNEIILPPNTDLYTVKIMINILPRIMSGVTNTDGFRKKLSELLLKELEAKKLELGGSN
ncbi:MAG: hypothetical protein A2563_00990 [Candidatus Magasanikbacteria bacterium RIFOXYD1_FULL_40_23]|uniref:Uncharacterized protein n=1 Tax=Candidatus Magasanikbacteria bacterium RIFOXYD1_FULL_40_23 TaxID=1798705 RepID=A0A1F6P878_9BACT|nr:MAG: hypothetical protein A2563_00990 [Candidatus Magasanikbacteria bacterium RIFOXYD1_FULL_40_23]